MGFENLCGTGIEMIVRISGGKGGIRAPSASTGGMPFDLTNY